MTPEHEIVPKQAELSVDVIKHHGMTDPLILLAVLEHHGVSKEKVRKVSFSSFHVLTTLNAYMGFIDLQIYKLNNSVLSCTQ